MPSQRNINDLTDLKEKLARSKSVVLADYKGLSVAKLTQLRNQLKASGAEIKVIKNTLLNLAFKEKKYAIPEADKELTGPSAIIFAYEDELTPVKILYDFAKENSLPKFKIGFLGTDFLSADRVTQLGQLPGKEVLIAQVVGSLNAPLSGLVNVLQGNLRKLVYVLEQIKTQSAKVKNKQSLFSRKLENRTQN
jgi:large subunit ribosomal protein L10